MEPINLNDYDSASYVLLRAGRPDWAHPFGEHLPAGALISLSSCICRQRFSLFWGWIPGDWDAALKFGIPDSLRDDFKVWCAGDYRDAMDVPSIFYSPAAARAFVRRFALNTDNLFIIGVGLPKKLHDAWLKKQPDDRGVARRVKQSMPMAQGGVPLGYEVVSYSDTDFSHSWLCSGLEQEMYTRFGIRANAWGLLDSAADAQQIDEWIAEDEGRGTRAEPEPYAFWLLVSYPLVAGK